MTKQIPLSQGLFAVVDDIDFENQNQHKWYAEKNGKTFYAARQEGKWPFKKTIYMHREIMNTPKGMKTDHKDGNGLNNTRENLRNCTHTQNKQNTGKQSINTTGYKGVFSEQGQWRARIRVNGKLIHLGYFKTAEEAARAYDDAAKQYHGEFARTNF